MDVSDRYDLSAYFTFWPFHGTRQAFLLTESLRVIWASSALVAVDRTAPIRVSGDALIFADRAKQAHFSAFAERVASEPSVWVYEKESAGFLLIRCERFKPDGQAAVLGCLISDTHSQDSHVWADLGHVFGLTSAEAVLARRLADGELLVNVAVALSITQETAKTHLRRVYAKLGVSSREEFYAKLLPFRVN